jgi:hypothetical protein
VSNLATIGWPSGTDTGWPSEPRNMLPGRIEGYPQGSQRSANTAERLLSQAVGWWDAAAYRDGDRLLRNRGVAGELLDLQLGSSDRVATTNDPLFLAPEDTGYVYQPGGTTNRLTVPDENALDITGDIELIARVSSDDWTPSSTTAICGKYGAAGNRSYSLRIETGGQLRLTRTTNGITAINVESTVAPSFSDGTTYWVRVTLDVDNGASGNDVAFYFAADSPSLPTSWTQIGTTVTTASVASIFNSTAVFAVGYTDQAATGLSGKVYRAIVKDGIDGTTVLDIDCDAITDGSATSFQAVTGQTVTINRSTAGRKSVAVPRRNGGGRSLFLLGTDDYFECVANWQHQLLNFAQGDSLSIVAVVRLWNNVISAGRIIGKYDTAGGAGWAVSSTTTTHGATITAADGVTSQTAATAASTNGTFRVFSGTLDRAAQRITPYLNDAAGTFGTLSNGGLVNVLPLRIGRQSGDSTTYQNLEVTAAAVFRRPLTASEIATITTYYTNRGF